MYEDVVKELRNLIRAYKATDNGNCHQAKILAKAVDVIEEKDMAFKHLERDYKKLCNHLPKWIPVTEKLPKEEKRTYWICTDAGYQCECRWTNDMFGIGGSDSWGWCIVDVPQYHKVMAWMFLPEPYKPQEEET